MALEAETNIRRETRWVMDITLLERASNGVLLSCLEARAGGGLGNVGRRSTESCDLPERAQACSSLRYKTGTATPKKVWRRQDHKARPIKYLPNKDLEAAGVDLPQSSNSRMI